MAGVSVAATVADGTSPCTDDNGRPGRASTGLTGEVRPASSPKESRRRRNARRKLARRLCAEGRAKPPLVALSRAEMCRLTGCTPEEYDQYAEQFILNAKKARRRWEFPLEVRLG